MSLRSTDIPARAPAAPTVPAKNILAIGGFFLSHPITPLAAPPPPTPLLHGGKLQRYSLLTQMVVPVDTRNPLALSLLLSFSFRLGAMLCQVLTRTVSTRHLARERGMPRAPAVAAKHLGYRRVLPLPACRPSCRPTTTETANATRQSSCAAQPASGVARERTRPSSRRRGTVVAAAYCHARAAAHSPLLLLLMMMRTYRTHSWVGSDYWGGPLADQQN